ncbi:MAG: hypothetical protein MI739_09595 [Bacteroidales bacterium]|nr:hypothetical protein [Bacteroidales bacterium]
MRRIIILIFTLGLIASYGLCQNFNFLKLKHLELQQQDSIIKFTVIIEPDGSFYFKKGLIYDTKGLGNLYRFNKQRESVKDSILIDTENKIKIDSRFEILIKDSTSYKNHYPHTYSFEPFIKELQYSYILNNLIEPKLFQKSGEKVLRFIIPKKISKSERDYYSIRVELNKGLLVHKMGYFNNNLDYILSDNDSISLSGKQVEKIISRLDQIDFNEEKYFTEVGLNFYPKYLIEYYNGSDYFVFEKQLFSRNKGDKEFNRLIVEILKIKIK